MTTSRQNQEKLQYQQLEQSNGGVLLKNIFSIYAAHPWLSLLFVIFFALFTSSLFEVINCLFGKSSFSLPIIASITGLLVILLVSIFSIVWRLHYGSVKPKDITQKRVLITLVSAHKDDFKDSPSREVFDAIVYTNSRQPRQNLLDEVILIATEDASTQKTANELIEYIESFSRSASLKTVSVNDKYPDDIKKQLAVILKDVMLTHNANDIICDYTGGTKNMSIALYSLARQNFVTAVYLYAAMKKGSRP